ncbi:hypothetical protein KA005_72780 [bacterium]|nr:hypothetical protein [bacterium]
MLKKLLYKWLLPKLIGRACKSRIPRSGKQGAKADCYVVALDRDSSPFFVATGYKNGTLSGLKWDGNSYADEHSLELSDLENGNFRVTHYYGLSEVRYDSIYRVAWNYLTKLVYLKIRAYRLISSVNQYFFNKRKLVTKKRMELLQFMIDDQLDREHKGISSLDLMTKLYSINWVLHPSGDDQQEKLELYLDSLADTGELQNINDEYVVTGKAISTIEKYEEEERRHVEAVKLQRKMVYLTIILAFVALVQSGLIKLPTLLDLSNTFITEETHNKAHALGRREGASN